MDMAGKKKDCAVRIRQRFGLAEVPVIQVVRNNLVVLADGWSYKIAFPDGAVELPDKYCYDVFFDSPGNPKNPIEVLRHEYPQLFYDADKNAGFETDVTEVRATLGSVCISAGFNWTISGTIRGTDKMFCAVLYVYTRELFRSCGIAGLLKKDEIELAAERGCSFIQTWHKKDNPNFYAAIAPGLKEDFFLYHGSNAGGEEYEESEYIHLRKYLDGQSFSSRVQFGGRSQKLISPRDNAKISELFRTTSEEYPGMLVKAVSKPED